MRDDRVAGVRDFSPSAWVGEYRPVRTSNGQAINEEDQVKILFVGGGGIISTHCLEIAKACAGEVLFLDRGQSDMAQTPAVTASGGSPTGSQSLHVRIAAKSSPGYLSPDHQRSRHIIMCSPYLEKLAS